MQQALISRLTGQLLLSHRLISYQETNDEVRLQFNDGKSTTCDLLVGMDGINSAVRKCFLLKHGLPKSPSLHPIWTGTVAYRGLVPIEKLEVELPGHRAVHTPMIVSSDRLLRPYLSLRCNSIHFKYAGKLKVRELLLRVNFSLIFMPLASSRVSRLKRRTHQRCCIYHRFDQTRDSLSRVHHSSLHTRRGFKHVLWVGSRSPGLASCMYHHLLANMP